MVVGHLAEFIFRRLKPLRQVITKPQQLNHILQQQLQQHILLLGNHAITPHPLKNLHSLTQERYNRQNTIILPLLNKINLRKLKIVLLLVLIRRLQISKSISDLEILLEGEVGLGLDVLDDEEVFGRAV